MSEPDDRLEALTGREARRMVEEFMDRHSPRSALECGAFRGYGSFIAAKAARDGYETGMAAATDAFMDADRDGCFSEWDAGSRAAFLAAFSSDGFVLTERGGRQMIDLDIDGDHWRQVGTRLASALTGFRVMATASRDVAPEDRGSDFDADGHQLYAAKAGTPHRRT